ncbi:serine/threonine protein phosphatase [Plantactinospora endophytica]|uniref:Serine/threonine protein phosphatase n=1 Tax=Plantactinospora endophytica TaxID=673535 RepID=A0ABQ4DYN8_9ACTN|nr:serine/threonine protein phosphatase [Plantactinospora endophytica]GIG87574.1 hypothetical protein Pen02_25100 [Plantactinospora endophytica]
MIALTRHDTENSHGARLAGHGRVATALALLSDQELGRLVAGARHLGAGIGGTSAVLDVDGVPVFVKRVPLTDLERRPENVRSTANLFGLPTYCHYGVGGPGFGAWRELAATIWTTQQVIGGQSAAFPLMYHWRLLPGAPPLADELVDVERVVAYWDGSPAVRVRIEALASASASVLLFLEYIPDTLDNWLDGRLRSGAGAVVAAAEMVERCLRTDIPAMNASGLLHFDAHFGNILTDGRRLYLADLGLATSPRFDLSPAEADFVARNLSHDLCYALTRLVNWLVSNVCGVPTPRTGGPVARNEYVRRCAAGAEVVGVPAEVAAIVSRYAPIAAIVNDFYWDLFGESRTAPYPAEAVARAMAEVPGLAQPAPLTR